MKSPCIELPLGDTIDCWCLTRAIAKATHPTLEDAQGIECVIGKIVPHPNIEEHFQLPYKLTDDDRTALEPLLERLPELHGKMTDLEIDTFLYLYSALPNRLTWVPRLNSRAEIDRIEFEQWHIQTVHREQLQQRLQDGRIQAFDSDHIPEKRIGPNVYIPRKQAVAYLLECGIQIGSADESKNLSKIEPKDISQMDVNCSLESAKLNVDPLQTPTRLPSHKGEQDEWTVDELKILSDRQKALKMEHNDYTKRVAEEFGISTSRVRQLLTEAKKRKPEENQFFPRLGQR